MKKIKELFGDFKLFEVVFVVIALTVVITLSIVFNSHIFYIMSSVFGIIGIMFLAKAKVLGIVICIGQVVFYSIISYIDGFYGEIINNMCIILPLYIANLIVWFKNLFDKEGGVVKINSKVSVKEIVFAILVVAILSVGMYFLLDLFNTTLVFVSTLSFTFNTLAIYFLVRRSQINFIFYMFSNIANFVMWGIVIINQNNFSKILTIVQTFVYFLLNIYGIINWIRTKNKQNEDTSFDVVRRVLKEKI